MNESEQAQTTRYRAVHHLNQMTTEHDGEWVRYESYKSIVDSQAQKIVELENRNAGNLALLKEAQTRFELAYEDGVKQARKIAELDGDCIRYDEAIMVQGKNAGELRYKLAKQAKEIERLNQRSKLLQDIVDCALAINSARKMCGKGPIDPNIDYFAKQLADFDSEVKP